MMSFLSLSWHDDNEKEKKKERIEENKMGERKYMINRGKTIDTTIQLKIKHAKSED